MLPAPLQAPVARYAASPRMYNLVVSNVPGPRVPVYLLGAECVEVLPAIPLSEGHALSIGVFTLRDRVCFGAYADPEALPQARELPAALSVATLELSAARVNRLAARQHRHELGDPLRARLGSLDVLDAVEDRVAVVGVEPLERRRPRPARRRARRAGRPAPSRCFGES